MQSDWASENLQIIRTLMERSAIYRRALAPLMALLGLTGLAATGVAFFIFFQTPQAFAGYWMAISALSLVEAFLLVRRQALNAAEPFWSSPTRRVAQALLPPLFGGSALGLSFLVFGSRNPLPIWALVSGWMVLYGCALHSAGFFMPRGFKLFGWGFIVAGCGLAFVSLCYNALPQMAWANGLMGVCFGGAHLAYGIYLYFTEKTRDAS